MFGMSGRLFDFHASPLVFSNHCVDIDNYCQSDNKSHVEYVYEYNNNNNNKVPVIVKVKNQLLDLMLDLADSVN